MYYSVQKMIFDLHFQMWKPPKCPVRYKITLDRYKLKDAYHSVCHAGLGFYGYCRVHFSPTYRQIVKSAKLEVKIVQGWTRKAKLELLVYFDHTVWGMVEDAAKEQG